MRRTLLLLAVVACLGITGCSSRLIQPVDPASMNDSIAPNEAAIVFFRSAKFMGSAIQISVIEVDENSKKLNFITINSAGKKYFHRTTPGRHMYVSAAFGGPGNMLLADIEPGKFYYVDIYPGFGNCFEPVPDVTDDTFKRNFASCQWVQNTQGAEFWFTGNLQSLYEKVANAFTREQKFIRPEYGTTSSIK